MTEPSPNRLKVLLILPLGSGDIYDFDYCDRDYATVFLFSWFKYVEGVEHCGNVLHASECLATDTWGDILNMSRRERVIFKLT